MQELRQKRRKALYWEINVASKVKKSQRCFIHWKMAWEIQVMLQKLAVKPLSMLFQTPPCSYFHF